ncbi:hypothetical protein ACYSNX_05725 [Myroides sp. LJL115]
MKSCFYDTQYNKNHHEIESILIQFLCFPTIKIVDMDLRIVL